MSTTTQTTVKEQRRYHIERDGRRHLIVRLKGWDGIVVRWSQHCSGCTETPENTSPAFRGCGCQECGYSGRSRRVEWVPIDADAYMKWSGRVWKRLEAWRARRRLLPSPSPAAAGEGR